MTFSMYTTIHIFFRFTTNCSQSSWEWTYVNHLCFAEEHRNEIEIWKTKQKTIGKLKLFLRIIFIYFLIIILNIYYAIVTKLLHQRQHILHLTSIYLPSAMHESYTPSKSFQFRYAIIKQRKCIIALGYNTRIGEKEARYILIIISNCKFNSKLSKEKANQAL